MTHWSEPRWTPADLAPDKLCGRRGAALHTAEIARRAAGEAESWKGLRPLPASAASGVAGIVLIGGAGLLGAQIAARLLVEADDAPVVVVSRRPDEIARRWASFTGEARAAALLNHPRLLRVGADVTADDDSWTGRVPRAGLVIHLAAAMHALAGWSALADLNLCGLRHAVRLARRDDALLQLASTLSVFVSSNSARADEEGPLPEREDLWLHGGYAQTKAAAELALALCPVRSQVVRYGLFVPEAGTPFPDRHLAPAFLSALLRVGVVPDVAERASVDLTPVGGAAEASLRLAGADEADWRHWANPRAAELSEVVAAIEAVRGPFPRQPLADWLDTVRALPPIQRALLRAAFDKSGFLAEEASVAPVLNLDLFQSTQRRFLPPGLRSDGPPPPEQLVGGVVRSMLASLEGARG